MTEDKIKELNKLSKSYEQGIYLQPYGIPVDIKTSVVYMRWESGGYEGGNCWDDTDPYPYENPEPNFEILDIVLKELAPDISYLHFKEIEKLAEENSQYKREYYGNSTHYKVKYIILENLEKTLQQMGYLS